MKSSDDWRRSNLHVQLEYIYHKKKSGVCKQNVYRPCICISLVNLDNATLLLVELYVFTTCTTAVEISFTVIFIYTYIYNLFICLGYL